MKSSNGYLSHLSFVILCLLLNNIEANKKLQRIILASLLSKTLKSHMNHGPSVVPIVMPPPFKA